MKTGGRTDAPIVGLRIQTSKFVRRSLALLGTFSLPLMAGCSIYGPTTRNAFYETRLIFDESCEYVRNCLLADSSWKEFEKNDSAVEYSKDFEHGFKAGFKSYLDYGANAGIPPIPPKHYWWLCKEGPENLQRDGEWHSGFLRGREFAQASGFREMIIVPALVPALKAPDDTIDVLTAMSRGPRGGTQPSRQSTTGPTAAPTDASGVILPGENVKSGAEQPLPGQQDSINLKPVSPSLTPRP
ncbi:hypothetical protein BH10PLA2_BH10PLA2_16450 [soil metagenome]